jgi:hypothetical protein
MIVVLLVVVANPSRAGGTSRQVAITGTDSGDCTDPNNPCRTVQYAVDAAQDEDTIKIAAGVYTGVVSRNGLSSMVHITKSLAIQAGYAPGFDGPPDPDANAVLLDAQWQGRGLTIGGDITVTLEGLRITRGSVVEDGGAIKALGAGVRVTTATVTISNSHIYQNGAEGAGGGLYLDHADTTVTGSKISNNHASRVVSASAGGLEAIESKVTLIGNIISGNSASAYAVHGGGLNLIDSDATLVGNTIAGNVAEGSRFGGLGGGLYVKGGQVSLLGNQITGNRNTEGYGVWPSEGGGLRLESVRATLVNNVLTGNSGRLGSGLYLADSSAQLLHTTIAANSGGSGVHVAGPPESAGSAVVMTNTILVSHTVGITVAAGSTASLEATLWGSGDWANGNDWDGDGTIYTGSRNYWQEPAFADPGTGDYHIGYLSAALDTGVDAGIGTDIEGDSRPDRCGFDLGADELNTGSECKRTHFPLVLKNGP